MRLGRAVVLRRRSRHNVVLLMLGLVGAASLSSCSGSGGSTPEPTAPPPTVAKLHISANLVTRLSEQNNRDGAFLPFNGTLLISLPVAKGSRAVWQLTDPVGPELKQIRAPATTPGTQVLAFHGAATGDVTVRLHKSTGGNWYAVVAVWTIHLSPKNFAPPGSGVTLIPKHKH
jgi:hypothetical protein